VVYCSEPDDSRLTQMQSEIARQRINAELGKFSNQWGELVVTDAELQCRPAVVPKLCVCGADDFDKWRTFGGRRLN
jgi:hypothetical protein